MFKNFYTLYKNVLATIDKILFLWVSFNKTNIIQLRSSNCVFNYLNVFLRINKHKKGTLFNSKKLELVWGKIFYMRRLARSSTSKSQLIKKLTRKSQIHIFLNLFINKTFFNFKILKINLRILWCTHIKLNQILLITY